MGQGPGNMEYQNDQRRIDNHTYSPRERPKHVCKKRISQLPKEQQPARASTWLAQSTPC